MEKRMQQEQSSPPQVETTPKKKKRLGKKGKWLLLILILAVAAGFLAIRHLGRQQTSAAVSYQEATVETRDITRSLTASGTLEPADSYTVSTLVDGEILGDTFEEGDLVEKGQLLYTLDSSDASSALTQSQNSYTQAQSNYDQAVKNKYPSADMSGTVSEVYVRNGDAVNAGTEILKIVGDNNICIDFIFSYAQSDDFYVGQRADIFINGFAGTIQGTVRQVSQSSTASGNAAGSGRELTTVRVEAANPGLVTEDYTASAVIGSYSSYGNAAVRVSASSTITAGTSGKISGLNLLAGDTVSEGDRICTITGDNVDNSIENARISVSNAPQAPLLKEERRMGQQQRRDD